MSSTASDSDEKTTDSTDDEPESVVQTALAAGVTDADEEPPETDRDADAAIVTQVTAQSGNDERSTPLRIIRAFTEALNGRFDLDPCSGAEPTPIAQTRFTKADNGLAKSWEGYETVFVNPPYSDLLSWLKKTHREATRETPTAPEVIIMLVPVNTSTEWFQDHATASDYVCFVEGRLEFGDTGGSAPFASAFLVYGEPSQDVLDVLDRLGTVYTREVVSKAAEQSRLSDIVETDGGATGLTPTPATSSDAIAGHNEPIIADTSRLAPATPQGVIDFRDVHIGDVLTLAVDTSTLGVPETIPSPVSLTVENGTAADTTTAAAPDDWNTLTGYASGGAELWAALHQDPVGKQPIRATVHTPDTHGWQPVPLAKLIRTTATTNPPAIEPYGPDTSFVN